LPWTRIDALHQLILDDRLVKSRVDGLTEVEKIIWITCSIG
jgi:hypothetical protein